MRAIPLIFTLFWAVDGQASGVPEQCRNSAHYDRVVMSLGGRAENARHCSQLIRAIADSERRAAGFRAQTISAGGDQFGGQAGGFHDAAQAAGAGAMSHEQRARLAEEVFDQSSKVAVAAEDKINALDEEYQSLSPRIAAAQANQVHVAFQNARSEFVGVKRRSLNNAEAAARAGGHSGRVGQRLRNEANWNKTQADQLGGGAKSGGVSANTKFAVGGAALIAAGTVGGLYFVTQKAIKSADRAAENRINQAEKSVKEILEDAEKRAARIIELARDSATQVLKDAEKTADRILQKAKDGAEELARKLREELKEDIKELTDLGIEKLRAELDSVFQLLIERAMKDGKTELVETLSKSRSDILDFLNQELKKRKSQVQTQSATSTSTATDTSTSTESGTSTSTRTEGSIGTATETERDVTTFIPPRL